MGSFLIQCCATKQVILEGTPCRIVPMRQTHDYTSVACSFHDDTPAQMHYPMADSVSIADSWKPVAGFLEAEGADCGKQMLLETDENRRVLGSLYVQLMTNCAIVPEGGNDSHEIKFNMGDLLENYAPVWFKALNPRPENDIPLISWAEAIAVWVPLQKAIWKKRVFIHEHWHQGTPIFRPFALGIIHEEAYQHLLKLGETTKIFGRSVARGPFLKDLVSKGFQSSHSMPNKDDDPEEKSAKAFMQTYFVTDTLHSGLRKVYPDAVGYSMFHQELQSAVNKLIAGETVEEALLIPMKRVWDDMYVLHGLDLCNVALEAQRYADQDYSNEAGQRFAKLVSATCKAVKADVKKRYEE